MIFSQLTRAESPEQITELLSIPEVQQTGQGNGIIARSKGHSPELHRQLTLPLVDGC
jgi:hypothetical protein